MDLFQQRHQLGDVEASGTAHAGAEGPTGHLAAKTRPLQVEEARRPLQVRQGVGIGGHQPFELGAGGQLVFQHVQEGGVVALQDAEGPPDRRP